MVSKLYGYFKMCYENGTLTKEQVYNGVGKGHMTAKEYKQITGERYVTPKA